jgi:hypothetical protein
MKGLLGGDDGCGSNWICRGDCDGLFCVPANLNQSTAKQGKEVKNGKLPQVLLSR